MFSQPIKSILNQDICYTNLEGIITKLKAGQVISVTKYQPQFGWLDTHGKTVRSQEPEFLYDDGEYLVLLTQDQFKTID